MQFFYPTAQLRMAARLAQAWAGANRTKDHRHAFYELAFLIEGRCAWRLGGRRRVELAAGDAFLLPPQRLHREEVPTDSTARLVWIGFGLDGPPAFLAPLLERPLPCGPWATDILALSDMLYREHQRPELPQTSQRVQGLMHALLATLLRIGEGADETPAPGRHGAALRAAAHTLRRNLVQPPAASALARQHGLTPGHFSGLFSTAHGLPPRAFLQRARIDEARTLLLRGQHTIKEIAAACGYAGAPHFCRMFKRATGLSPRVWRVRSTTAQGLPN